jgi:hypothetical protein
MHERIEHEAARAELRVRDRETRPAPRALGPEQDIEIEHPRPPAPSGAAAKGALDGLQPGE